MIKTPKPTGKGIRYGGRKPGTPNKMTAEVRELARYHGSDAIQELARIALHSKTDQARVAAIKELLDRGYGKSPQAIEHSGSVGTTDLSGLSSAQLFQLDSLFVAIG